MIVAIIVIGIILIPITILWVKGIDNMKENYPDYLGDDLFDEDDKNHVL
jgi:hypothetical protein